MNAKKLPTPEGMGSVRIQRLAIVLAVGAMLVLAAMVLWPADPPKPPPIPEAPPAVAVVQR